MTKGEVMGFLKEHKTDILYLTIAGVMGAVTYKAGVKHVYKNHTVVGDNIVAEVRQEKANKKLLNSRFGLQSMPYHDLMMENRRLLQEQAYFEDQINTLNATCEGYADNINAYRKDVDQLTRENKKLIEEQDALWAETQHLDKIYKQLLNEKKRLQENFEELKASSDLSMTAELAEIFAEFTDKDKENRDDLSVKIDEFREKYQFE